MENYRPISILPTFSKIYEGLYTTKYIYIFINLFRNSIVVFQNVLMLNTTWSRWKKFRKGQWMEVIGQVLF